MVFLWTELKWRDLMLAVTIAKLARHLLALGIMQTLRVGSHFAAGLHKASRLTERLH
jgi:hypothetical protein